MEFRECPPSRLPFSPTVCSRSCAPGPRGPLRLGILGSGRERHQRRQELHGVCIARARARARSRARARARALAATPKARAMRTCTRAARRRPYPCETRSLACAQ
eukprot:4478569-Pleurochrysis_carterae.AAC.2